MVDRSMKWKRKRMPQNHGWWKTLKNAIYERDGKRCQVCGYPKSLTVDHIIPLAWGGTNSKENLQILCILCHSRKTRIERRWNKTMMTDESTAGSITPEGGNVVGGDSQPVQPEQPTGSTPTPAPEQPATPDTAEEAATEGAEEGMQEATGNEPETTPV